MLLASKKELKPFYMGGVEILIYHCFLYNKKLVFFLYSGLYFVFSCVY